ncbi:MAG: hypothetical protein HW406_1355 [Candidatus Brocadiaceae bacterium]|nr:hypothetical protein [Candidatus Brocadiaceae bacterium]
MRIFVDTSAFFALLDRDDANHKKAKEVWNKGLNLLIPILKNRVFIAFLKRSREQVFNLNVMRDRHYLFVLVSSDCLLARRLPFSHEFRKDNVTDLRNLEKYFDDNFLFG